MTILNDITSHQLVEYSRLSLFLDSFGFVLIAINLPLLKFKRKSEEIEIDINNLKKHPILKNYIAPNLSVISNESIHPSLEFGHNIVDLINCLTRIQKSYLKKLMPNEIQ